MAGRVLNLEDIINPDMIGCAIAEKYVTWETYRNKQGETWKEVAEYIFATDTLSTSNSKLPWSNKTTIPKICQIRDNLHSNYMATLFPNNNWLTWEGDRLEDNETDKKEVIEHYMRWVTDRNWYYDTISRLVYDYIDYGNCFVMPEWLDQTVVLDDREQVGYVGPVLRRISPTDIVFNPAAPSFEESPKIVRTIVSMGELKDILRSNLNDPEEIEQANNLYEYIKDYRNRCLAHQGTLKVKDRIYDIAGIGTFRDYVQSNAVEILTFYGDIYDDANDTFLKNVCIKIVDRHKVFYNKPNPSYFGTAPIYHAGWRLRNDNLWAMGPLDNLIGMQYRIDHLENMKADVFDLIAYPPMKIKGYVDDFKWGPMERIYVGDDGDVELMSPDVQALQAQTEIAILEAKMEEMAGSPREAMGIRSPGEKTKYEVQSLENAVGRIFQAKVAQFERHVVEPSCNGMLEIARRNMNTQVIRVFDDEFKSAIFTELTRYDLAGLGRIKPMAARHFAEKANMLQNLSSFFQSSAGSDPEVMQHFSSIRLAQMYENLLEIQKYKIVEPNVRLTERTETQNLANNLEEDSLMQTQTATGIQPGDYDLNEEAFPTVGDAT